MTPEKFDIAPPRNDLTLIVACLAIVSTAVFFLTQFPEQAKVTADHLFSAATLTFGSLVQLIGFICVVLIVGLAFSKYGSIKLGTGKAEYSNVSWMFMFICAGLGSATMYWAFMEWSYYYLTPGLGIAGASQQALEYSIAYSFFHWGATPWSIYGIASLAMAYHFHVRRNKGLSLAAVVEAMTGFKATGPVGRVIDLIFLFSTFGGLVLTTTLTTSTVARGIAEFTGLNDGFALKASLVVLVTLVFSLSSYIGIGSGMQRLAKVACGLTLGFGVLVLVLGPTEFIINNVTNAVGIAVQHFVQMSLSTDPVGGSDFARSWTAFYWLYWITYTPGMAIFVTRISRGRTIREVIMAMILGGCGGCWFFFGSLQSFAIHQFVTGVVNAPALLSSAGGGEAAVSMLLHSLPMGRLLAGVYYCLMLVFLASHLDAVAYTVAATSTRNLREGDDPTPNLRLFWCALLAALPLSMLYINAPLSTLKTAVILTAIPFIAVLAVKIWGLLRWLQQDYAHLSAGQILAQGRAQEGAETPRHAAPRSAEPASAYEAVP